MVFVLVVVAMRTPPAPIELNWIPFLSLVGEMPRVVAMMPGTILLFFFLRLSERKEVVLSMVIDSRRRLTTPSKDFLLVDCCLEV